MDVLNTYVNERYHLTLFVSVGFLVLAGQFDNHLWRLLVIALYCIVSTPVVSNTHVIPTLPWWGLALVCSCMMHLPVMRRKLKRKGCVFVTGADSGMGQATVVHLAKTNTVDNSYDVIFAGCYNAKKSQEALKELCHANGADFTKIKVVPLDVTSDSSVSDAAQLVSKTMAEMTNTIGLSALVNYHGIAYNGPVEYMPIELYQRQYDVNYIGNIRMTQHFLPLIKASSQQGQHRGRLIFTGTGGGPCTPLPPLLSAYMSSKFACEAFVGCLSAELHMMKYDIDTAVINPGFVKPTMLMEDGKRLTEQMWKQCKEQWGHDLAKEEYGPLLNHFVLYSELMPGAHVSKVCEAAEHALTAYRPRSSYKVGIDSKLAPFVGMLPTGVRKTIALHGMYGILSPAGTVKGYRV